MLIIILTTLLWGLRSILPVPQPNAPFWIQLLLVLEPALEFPMIFAFHPTVMAYDIRLKAHLPHAEQLISQVGVFFAVEMAFQECVLRFIIAPKTMSGASDLQDMSEHSPPEGPHYQEAEKLVLDFSRPRGALLLAIALLGPPTRLNRYTGQLHPIAMVIWVVVQQLL